MKPNVIHLFEERRRSNGDRSVRDKIFASACKINFRAGFRGATIGDERRMNGSGCKNNVKTRTYRHRRRRRCFGENSRAGYATRRDAAKEITVSLPSRVLYPPSSLGHDSRTARSYPTSSTHAVRDHPGAICLVYEWHVAAGVRVSEFPSSPREKALRLPLRRLELYYW